MYPWVLGLILKPLEFMGAALKKSVIALAMGVLVGCAATGVKISDDQLASLHKGETTLAQVLASFGPPTSKIKAADGTTTLQYVYAEHKVRAASFVPVVGLFAGGADIRTSVASLRFNPDGTLLDVTSAESQYGTGIGASAGQVAPGQVQQPRQ